MCPQTMSPDLTPWRGQDDETLIWKKPTPTDVVVLLADTIDHVRVGNMDPKVANSVGYLGGIILKALETEALEERLAAIEAAVLGSQL